MASAGTRPQRCCGERNKPLRCIFLVAPPWLINGRESVNRLLRALHLYNRNLEDQVKGMIGLIGQFGISDSFVIDVLADDIAALASQLVAHQTPPKLKVADAKGRSLPYLTRQNASLFKKVRPRGFPEMGVTSGHHLRLLGGRLQACHQWLSYSGRQRAPRCIEQVST